MIVIDASACVALLLEAPNASALAERVARHRDLAAPHLLDLEVVQSLRRYRRTERLSEHRAAAALQDFQDLAIERYPHEPFASRCWSLRHNFTAYDAVYVALAESLGVPLLTLDAKFSRTPGHQARIERV